MSTRTENAELYRELQIPFESEHDATEAMHKFADMVREARVACRIPDVVVAAEVTMKIGDTEEVGNVIFSYGSDFVAEGLSDRIVAEMRHRKKERMDKFDRDIAASHRKRIAVAADEDPVKVSSNPQSTAERQPYRVDDGVIVGALPTDGGKDVGPPFVTPDGVLRDCICARCLVESLDADELGSRGIWWMILCPKCGNKRCPHAEDHRNECTGSNEPGQIGSAFRSDVASAASPGFRD